MSSLFGRLKNSPGPLSAPTGASPSKKDPQQPLTPMQQLLADAGPLRNDGSDKFFGMINPQNTCYCNSVVQCLYFSDPFREQVVNFPFKTPRGPLDIANGDQRQKGNEGAANQDGVGFSFPMVDAFNQRKVLNPPALSTPPPVRTEDNKESFEYQKEQARRLLPKLIMAQGNFETYGMSESLFTSLKDIFEAVITHDSRVGIVHPASLIVSLRQNYELFRSPLHQDAHEFLNILLNEVLESVEAYSKKALEDSTKTDSSTQPVEPTSTPDPPTQSKPTSPSWVHELFEGTLTSETRCLTCESVSRRDETFLDLSVDLEEHSSVTSCLNKFSEEEMLCGKNKFHCDKCGGLQEAEKRMKIKNSPKILALHLKRFKYDEETDRMQKLFHRVVYPFYLRLMNTTAETEDPDRLYELYAVIVHLGSTPFHGHYVSIIKTKDRGWLLFDDELVLPVDKNYVRSFFGGEPKNPACAYVLFYQETTAEKVQQEQEIENGDIIATTSSQNPTGLNINLNGTLSPPMSPIDPTPLAESDDPFTDLEHATTAPLDSSYVVSMPRAVASVTEEPVRESSGAFNAIKNSSFGRFRPNSLSIRRKSKFWSPKKDNELQEGTERDVLEDPGGLNESANVLAEKSPEPRERAEKSRSNRFNLGRKKSNMLV